ncbi:MAG: hypothetical protein M5U27_02285 [Gaiella sp.]|nr:hypothetical protein [Gaiella sp.]
MASLNGVNLKLGRAEEHLDAIDAEIGRYIKSHPYIPVREYHPEPSRPDVVGLRIIEAPRPELALTVGDYLYNVRSALDHLAWQLVIANNGEPTNRTEFPIFKDSRTYENRVGEKVSGMHPMAAAFIEGLQPYNRRDGSLDHPLWLLHDLCNIDKHQTTLLAGTWVSEAIEFRLNLPSHADAQVFFFPLDRHLPPDQVEMYAERALQVTLAEPERLRDRPIVGLLQQSLDFVRKTVLPGLTPFVNERP